MEKKSQKKTEILDFRTKENNSMSSAIQVVTFIILIVAFIVRLIIWTERGEDPSFIEFALNILPFIFVFFIFYGFAEIIQILHDIRRKLWEK